MSAAAPTPPDAGSGSGLRWMYWSLGVVVVVLAIIGLITYSGQKDDQQAQQKAAQLSQKLEAAGLRVPDEDILVRSLGSDGGNVCENPASALGKATLHDQLTNGADFVGRRPVIVDRRVVQGEALILETYCPEKLEEYKDKIDDLKFDDTLKY
jgi:hypothetical protein